MRNVPPGTNTMPENRASSAAACNNIRNCTLIVVISRRTLRLTRTRPPRGIMRLAANAINASVMSHDSQNGRAYLPGTWNCHNRRGCHKTRHCSTFATIQKKTALNPLSAPRNASAAFDRHNHFLEGFTDLVSGFSRERSMGLNRSRAVAVWAVVLCAAASRANADEGGVSFWIPGNSAAL